MPKVHPLSDVKSSQVGKDTRIWQYAVVFDGAVIGENCNICAHTLIENGVTLGNNVTVKSGVYLWEGTQVADDVFIGPNATFTNDAMPRSKVYPDKFSGITINKGASVGANATILPGITIGAGAMVGAGAVVVADVPERAVVVGNPARVIRYISE